VRHVRVHAEGEQELRLQAPTLKSAEEVKKEEEMYLGPALKFDDAELEALRAEVASIGQVIEGKVVWAQSPRNRVRTCLSCTLHNPSSGAEFGCDIRSNIVTKHVQLAKPLTNTEDSGLIFLVILSDVDDGVEWRHGSGS
jgi:hypothetical protein